MHKLVISDMDGTLTYNIEQNNEYDPSHSELPEKNKEALLAFLAQGGIFAVSTGRLLPDILGVTGPVISEKIYKLTQNGSFLFDKDNKLVYKNTYPKKLLVETIQQMEAANIPFACSTYNSHYYKKATGIELIDKVFGKITPKIEVEDPSIIYTQEVANICLVNNSTEETKRAFKKISALLNTDVLNNQITGPYSIDINPKSVSKGNGANYLSDKLGIQAQDVAVVGDSFNDLSMFKNYEHSYCMSHSDEELRKQATNTIDMFYEVFSS